MSDRPFTDLLDKLDRGETLSDLECKLLVLEGRSYVRMLGIETDLFNAAAEERDEAWASLKDERTLRDERDAARFEAKCWKDAWDECERQYQDKVSPVAYAVVSGCYEEYSVLTLFSTPELAQRFIDRCDEDDRPSLAIEGWEVDEAVASLSDLVPWYCVQMRRDGTVTYCSKDDFRYMWAYQAELPELMGQWEGEGNNYCMTHQILGGHVRAETEAQAIVLMNEHRIQLIETGEWEDDR